MITLIAIILTIVAIIVLHRDTRKRKHSKPITIIIMASGILTYLSYGYLFNNIGSSVVPMEIGQGSGIVTFLVCLIPGVILSGLVVFIWNAIDNHRNRIIDKRKPSRLPKE